MTKTLAFLTGLLLLCAPTTPSGAQVIASEADGPVPLQVSSYVSRFTGGPCESLVSASFALNISGEELHIEFYPVRPSNCIPAALSLSLTEIAFPDLQSISIGQQPIFVDEREIETTVFTIMAGEIRWECRPGSYYRDRLDIHFDTRGEYIVFYRPSEGCGATQRVISTSYDIAD